MDAMLIHKPLHRNINSLRAFIFGFGFFLSQALLPGPLWAVQSHGGAEGLISHEIGHFLFALGMGYLLFRINRNAIRGKGWFEFKVFLLFILAWNILTFTGHWMAEKISEEKYQIVSGNIHSFNITDLFDLYFYFTRLDHLLLVPSFLFLLLALRKWREKQ
jgi:hypothetical protein